MTVLTTLLDRFNKYLPRSYTPLLLFFFGICLTLETTYFLIMVLDDRQQALFHNSVGRTESIIGDYVDMYGVMLRSTKGLLVVKPSTNQVEFKNFVDQLRMEERFPGIIGVGYSIKFTQGELPNISRQVAQLGVQNWQLNPTTPRTEYHSIIFLEPRTTPDSPVIGYDMFTEETRRTAMEKARDTGSLVLSGNVKLVQQNPDLPREGFLLYLPVYKPGTAPTSIEERRNRLAGFVYAPFRARDFFEAVFKNEKTPQLVDVTVYDGAQADPQKLLYTSVTESNYQPLHTTTRSLVVAGHTWTIVYTNKPEFEVFARREFVVFLLGGGLLSSLLLFIVSKKQVDARTRAEASERKLLASQDELKESEARFRLLVESAQDYAIMLLDPHGRINSWNVGAEKMFGYSESEILDQHFSIFFTPEGNAAKLPERELQRVQATGHSEDENWSVRKDGTYFWASGSSTAIYGDDGQLHGIAKIARDLSLRKKTEEVLRKNEALTQAVLQSLPAFIVVLDQKGKIIAINEAGNGEGSLRADLLQAVQVRKNYLELMKQFTTIDIATRRKIIAGIQAVLDERKTEFKYEYALPQRSIETWILLQVTPLKYSGSGVVVSHTDITERKNLEKQKDEFISIASHELKTPITSIKAYIQVLQTFVEKLGNERFTKIIGRVDRQITKLTNLVNDLLDVSKVESGQLKFNTEVFEFDALAQETVEAMQFTTHSHAIEYHGQSNIKVEGDRERISQVMVNLLSNAIKYSPDAEKVIVTTNIQKAEGKRWVQFCVQDFGVGIPKHQQKRIFERFYRATASTTFSGLGLGLYISAQIIRRLGGKIWVESSKDTGSRFCFTLPIV